LSKGLKERAPKGMRTRREKGHSGMVKGHKGMMGNKRVILREGNGMRRMMEAGERYSNSDEGRMSCEEKVSPT
jgi:hypothetical protein